MALENRALESSHDTEMIFGGGCWRTSLPRIPANVWEIQNPRVRIGVLQNLLELRGASPACVPNLWVGALAESLSLELLRTLLLVCSCPSFFRGQVTLGEEAPGLV